MSSPFRARKKFIGVMIKREACAEVLSNTMVLCLAVVKILAGSAREAEV